MRPLAKGILWRRPPLLKGWCLAVDWWSQHRQNQLCLGDWRIFEDVVASIRLCLRHISRWLVYINGQLTKLQKNGSHTDVLTLINGLLYKKVISKHNTYLTKWYVKYNLVHSYVMRTQIARLLLNLKVSLGHPRRTPRIYLSAPVHSTALLSLSRLPVRISSSRTLLARKNQSRRTQVSAGVTFNRQSRSLVFVYDTI